MSKFLLGWDEQSIVPQKKVKLDGQFFERISNYVETDVTVTAMAVEAEAGDDSAIIVSCDLVGIKKEVIEIARKKLNQLLPEFPTEKLIVGVTHTHTSLTIHEDATLGRDILEEFIPSGKEYTELVEEDDKVITAKEAIEFVTDKIALAAKNAWEKRSDAKYANEFGRAVVGFNRRVQYDDETAKMWGDTNTANFEALEGGNDSGIELLYMFDKDNKLTGIVANIACPSQVLEHRSFISADYWGYVKEILRKKFGNNIYLLAMCGAGGDQCPRDLVRWVEPETPIDDPNIERPNVIERKADPSMFDIKGCKLVAKRIANEIISVYEEIEDIKDDIKFEHRAKILNLPLRRATMTEYNNAVREIEYYFNKNKDKEEFNFKDKAAMHVYAGTIERYREQQFKEIVPTEVHIIRFGDVAIATNPFELFLDFGNQIKARSYAKQTFIMQLTCDCFGYLPTAKAEKHGHYSAYISSGKIGHKGGEQLVRETITDINEMFK